MIQDNVPDTLTLNLHRVPKGAVIPARTRYYASAGNGEVMSLWAAEDRPGLGGKSFYTAQKLGEPQPELPNTPGDKIYDVTTRNGKRYGWAMRTATPCWDWVLVNEASAESNHIMSSEIESWSATPAPVERDPMDEGDKSPRVDVDDDFVVWDEVKQGWRFWKPGGESMSKSPTLENYETRWASIKGFATPEQVHEFGLDT